jgi:hypothetical protein
MQGAELILSKGDWVFHPRMPAWGYGQVLEVLSGTKGRVFFLSAGEKMLSWEHAGLGRVENDTISQAALDNQLTEFKVKLAKDLLTSEDLRQEVTCTSCESVSSKCELCKCASESLKVYSLSQKGKLCLCDRCRDKVMLETKNRAEIDQSITEMDKRGKKKSVDSENKKRKLKIVKK